MNFSITGNDPRNTEIVGPGLSYSVESPGTLKRQTTISRAGAAIAQIDWHAFSPDMLRMAGTERRVSEILWRPALFTAKREFAANGQTYTWTPSPSTMTLSRGNVPIATLQFGGWRGSTLHVSPEGGAILDTLVVSMVIVWKQQQQRAVGPGVSYSVQTPGMMKRHTTISRGGAAIAQIDWHSFSSDILRMGGAEMKVSNFLQRAGILSS
ncbi:hypothetical protein AURDEDRAFT_164950 [Auricularia subglabra TFB-10046 SS5]|nr:hypothetical protein AURDEDRAFT_164950 [Auricularia subglabra TFB-10046 SS5]